MYTEKEIIMIYQNCKSTLQVLEATRAFINLMIHGEQDYGNFIRRMAAITHRRILNHLSKRK